MLGQLYNRDASFSIFPFISTEQKFWTLLNATPGPKGIKIAMRPDPDLIHAKPTLRTTFDVRKTTNSDPNTADVDIYNLNEAHRKCITKGCGLVIEAGYVGSTSSIFSGLIVNVSHRHEGVDRITSIAAEDGGEAYASKRMSKSFPAGTLIQAIVIAVIQASGLGPGNAIARINLEASWRGKGIRTLKKATTISGRVSDILNNWVTSIGLQWFIHDDQLYILGKKETLTESLVVLSTSSGLIGTPELGEDEKTKATTVNATSLMQGGIKPGKRVVIQSEEANGQFKCDRVTHRGDTWGDDWYTEIEATAL